MIKGELVKLITKISARFFGLRLQNRRGRIAKELLTKQEALREEEKSGIVNEHRNNIWLPYDTR